MKKHILNCLIMLFCANAIAQSNFHKIYDYQNRSDGGYEIIESNKNFIVFGITSGGGTTMKFLKTDSVGNMIFHKSYLISNDRLWGGGQWFQSYYGFGYHTNPIEGAADSQFMYINDSGDSSKVVTINFEFNDRIHDAILLKDSTFIVMGFYTDSALTDNKPFVAHVDSLGSILWMKTHDDTTIVEIVNNIEATPDGGYVFGGYEEESPNGFQDLFLIKVDSNGDFEWKKNYGIPKKSEYEGHVTVCKDGGYAIAGNIVTLTGSTPVQITNSDRGLRKVDSAGNLIWQKKYGTTTYEEQFTVARELPNGDFICAGSSFHTYNNNDIPDINLSRLDSAGNLLWSKDFTYVAAGQQVHDYVKDIKVTSDSGFVLTGFITNVTGSSRNDVFILKTDGNGLITSLNSGFIEVPAAWKIYPNPTQGQIIIPESQNIKQIQVFNLQGQKVQEILPKQFGETNVKLQGVSGIYLIQLQMKDGSVNSTKIIKQ